MVFPNIPIINIGDTTYQFSLNGTDFAVGGELSSQDPDNCIFIKDDQGLDTFDFHMLRQGVTIDLSQFGGTSYITDLEYSPHAKIVCESLIENALGGFGSDIIKGNEFSNSLWGGRGADELTGCGGQDTFKYTSAVQSTVRQFDTITDFVSGGDRIDLHGIDANHKKHGNNAFDFIGGQKFHHQAGELRVTANNVLLGDLNGDGRADFKVAVQGDHVTEADIWL